MAARLKIEGDMAAGKFLSRTSRFSILAELGIEGGEGMVVECHLPNPGRLEELLIPGSSLILQPADDPERRKTKFDVFAVVTEGGTVVVDSRAANMIAKEGFASGELPKFSGYSLVRTEPPFGRSRLDFLLAGERPAIVEVKSCTLVRDGVALFPDAPTKRGRRHLQELLRAQHEGYRACVLFVVMREDAAALAPNDETDPAFGAALREAAAGGVEAIAIVARYKDGWLEVAGEVPVELFSPK
jgi:sugar fermentation stimulation protein A